MDAKEKKCPACGKPNACQEGVLPLCEACAERFPPDLIKCLEDDFDYELRLRTGETIRFAYGEIEGEGAWLKLSGVSEVNPPIRPFPRGVTVRIDDIVWICDAPEGS